MQLEPKIYNFFSEVIKEHDAHSILNETFLMLSQSVNYGLDSMIKSLHYQCIDGGTTINGVNLESGWESADGKHHLAIVCVKNDDSQEHCFGEWLENAQGVIVLEPSRDNEDAIQKAVSYLKTQGYEVSNNKDTENEKIFKAIEYLRTQGYAIIDTKSKDKGYEHAKDFLQSMGAMVYTDYQCEMEDTKDCGYLIVKDGCIYSSPIEDVIEYMESHNYKVFHENESIPEYLRNDGWYVTESQHFEAWATDIFKNIGFIVIDTNKPIDVDAINKSLAPKNFKVFPTDSYQSMIEHFENNSYEVFDVGADGGLSLMAEYLEIRGYTCVNSDNVNNFCIEHLTKEDYFVCQGGSDVESLVQLFHKEPEKFSNILQKTYIFRIDSLHRFNISCEVKSFSYQNAHIEMRKRLDKACFDINNSQNILHLNADLIQIVSM